MRYTRVFLDSIAYELPPQVVTSAELEERLAPLYRRLRIPEGQIEAVSGIVERRWWDEGFMVSTGAVTAARKALAHVGIDPQQVAAVIYGGVCRDQFEPATACRIAHALGVSIEAVVYDISNACLGVLSGMVDVANRIELGQIRAGLVVACETIREVSEVVIAQLLGEADLEMYRLSLAPLTGGSGAVAVLLTDGSFTGERGHRLLGGVAQAAPEHHGLCRWGIERVGTEVREFTRTDSAAVLKYGVALGAQTWRPFLRQMGWAVEEVDRIVCHQVGSAHRDGVLRAFGVPEQKDFCTFPFLGNIGTVSLPLTAAIAEERGLVQRGDRVGFLGVGSGLNSLMLGLEW